MKFNLIKGSRSKFLAVIVFAVMAIFIFRLFYLQVIKYDYYVQLATGTQVKRLEIPAKRGVIYALDNETPIPLVMNQTVFTVFADPQVAVDNEKIAKVVREIAGGSARNNLEELLAKEDSRYQILATKVTRLQADMIRKEGLAGVGFQEGVQRVYPEGQLASQTLGFVDHEGVGRYGVEGYLDDRLNGDDGLLQSVTDVSAVPLTIGDAYIDKPAINGDNLVLSIDRNIQSQIELILKNNLESTGANEGSVVVMNPNNGQIVAMTNLPTYDPSKLSQVDDLSVLNNGVVANPYEPGSVIKTLTMAIGIDKGVVSPTSTYYNSDYITVDDRTITNATKGQTGEISFQHALNWSLNTGFVTVAMRLGDGKSINRLARDTMYDYYYNRFGFGKQTGIEVDGEAKGIIWAPTEVEGNAVRYSNMSFGQGMNLTMVQVASAFSSLVNGGKYYKPTVLSGVIDKDDKYIKNKIVEPSLPILESTANQMRAMIHDARVQMSITGDKPGYYIGGKTGTSQVLDDGAYSLDGATIGTYLGFGGSEDRTEYVIMVRLSGDGESYSGQDARGVFTQISNYLLDYLKIQPKG